MSKFSNSTDEIRLNVVNKLNSVIDNKYLSKTIEKGIYNYVIETAKEKVIQRKWSNSIFKKLYLSKVISIYSNLNESTYIKNEKIF